MGLCALRPTVVGPARFRSWRIAFLAFLNTWFCIIQLHNLNSARPLRGENAHPLNGCLEESKPLKRIVSATFIGD